MPSTRFFTSSQDIFQLGMFDRPAGYCVAPHQHPGFHIETTKSAEFLFIEKGKAKITVFDDQWKLVTEEVVSSGDFLLFLDGGHAVEMLEPTRFIEVKQGPYPGDEQAKVFRDSK